jgi:hypothetical protein
LGLGVLIIASMNRKRISEASSQCIAKGSNYPKGMQLRVVLTQGNEVEMVFIQFSIVTR